MKRITTLCAALLLLLATAVPAAAQSFSWGVTAGMNLTKLSLSGNVKQTAYQNFSTDNKAGWYVGPKITFNTVIGLGVDASLQYSERNLSIDGESEKYRTVEIPLNLRYTLGMGSIASVYVATGPQFGFGLQNMSWENLLPGYPSNFSKNNMTTTWNIGAGVRLLKHLEVGVAYNFALSGVGKTIFDYSTGLGGASNDYQLRYKTNTFQVQAAYYF
ncbi:MAG: outer membrane beta-barrel protein [Alloprevotella sp.]